jgi:Fic family protein
MKKCFDYEKITENIDYELISLISEIREYRGKQLLFLQTKPQILDKLTDLAMVQSTEYSNKIEGIYTSADRLEDLLQNKATPRNRDEEEIVGYRNVLGIIHDQFAFIDIKVSNVLQLHKELYKFYPQPQRGKFKTQDNAIEEIINGERFLRFKPASTFETPMLLEELCEEYNREISVGKVDPLLLIPCFIFDFLSIHPFNDGNGRMSRLLTLLLLYQNDYLVGKFISLEMLVEKTKDSYYETLKESSQKWHENEQNYLPFIKYFLKIVLAAYVEFEERYQLLSNESLSSAEKILEAISSKFVPVSKKDIAAEIPNFAIITIERGLKKLLDEELIIKIGSGRSTKYKMK